MADDSRGDLLALEQAFDAAERDMRAVTAGLDDRLGGWHPEPGAWSVAECVDHLATSTRVYLEAMEPVAARALAAGRRRRGPAVPGLLGGWFARSMEPPKTKPRVPVKAPGKIRPRQSPPLGDALRTFLASQDDIRAFMRRYGDVDLAGVLFPNPFIPILRWSLATGLHVLAAHQRRHLAQAWRVRRAAEAAGAHG